ncbi:MAG TPA: citramalate synthase [Candidatus Hydrogenedentes bacterium]|nr:citramalate synthase [Candidatus Hydrogenedentota bacterium]
MQSTIEIYDTTLRDGAQGPGVKFSSGDQIRILRALDAFGITFVEGGQPGSNPKAADFFKQAKDLPLKKAVVVAFGSTRHPKSAVEDDPNIRALLEADTKVVTIFAKTSPSHTANVLRVSLDHNLRIIEDSVSYLRSRGRRVIVDAEHFFDACREDTGYALAALERAAAAGAETLVLCDTNGGTLPHEIAAAIRTVRAHLPKVKLGIHTHNDTGCAVANSIIAVHEGVTHVQGTINGYGERTGNANLSTIIPNLQLKMGIPVVKPAQLANLSRLSHLVAELANMTPRDCDPYVGRDAFTHKAGMHADAVRKEKTSYEHVDPAAVGNRTHVAISEMSGRASLLHKAADLGVSLDKDTPEMRSILSRIKELESQGYEFEGADASLELLMRKVKGQHRRFFKLHGFHATVTQQGDDPQSVSEATVKVEMPDGLIQHTVSEGHGPVDALNGALRKALEPCYPELRAVHLEDYKVRIIDAQAATGAKTRVMIESSDLQDRWSTVGVSENIISASYAALVDSIEYKLLRTRGHRAK